MSRSSMWLQRINPRFFLALFLTFSNFWIIKILKLNFLIGLFLIGVTLAIIFYPKKNVLIICTALLLFLQFQTTSIKNLSLLDNDEQRVQAERMLSYSQAYIDLRFRKVWFNPAWIERNEMIIVLSRIEENIFSNLDINKYFFGSFPRNKPEDFEKFPFFYLPIFVTGTYVLLKKEKFEKIIISLLMPLLALSFLGNNNKFGSFILFPFFIKSFLEGIDFIKNKFKKTSIFYLTFFVLIIIGFILQISYGKI